MSDLLKEATVRPKRPEPKRRHRSRMLPPFHVILFNDDDHSMDFVVEVVRKVFGYPMEKAVNLMLEAHQRGRCIVWTGSKEVAELKYEQVRTCHEIRQRDGKELGPLSCCIEAASA